MSRFRKRKYNDTSNASHYYTVLCCVDQKCITISGQDLEILQRKGDKQWVNYLHSLVPEDNDIDIVVRIRDIHSSTLESLLEFVRQNNEKPYNLTDHQCWSRAFFGSRDDDDLKELAIAAYDYSIEPLINVIREIYAFQKAMEFITSYPPDVMVAQCVYEAKQYQQNIKNK